MLAIYSLLLTAAFAVMLPLFFLRRQKYAAGFGQRLGRLSSLVPDGRKVGWVHCVSVGETNAARPLIDEIHRNFPDLRLVVSTTTLTGQELARKLFADAADEVVYFPFDWRFSVRRALEAIRPSFVLFVETEIWPRFYREAKKSGARLFIVNGRLSERSAANYRKVRRLVARVLSDLDAALMQSLTDRERIVSLGIDPDKCVVTGNLKFDHQTDGLEEAATADLRARFCSIDEQRPLIVAASTHAPEEKWLLDCYAELLRSSAENAPRLLIAPRHPQRFSEVAALIAEFAAREDITFAVRSDKLAESDRSANIILLDSIGELRSVYPLADIVFVGGSLVPHGGQSVLEPAAAGKAIVTGPHTSNFASVIKEFAANDAIIQLSTDGRPPLDTLFGTLKDLLHDTERRRELGNNAARVMEQNRGATLRTIQALTPYFLGTVRSEKGNDSQ